MGLETVGGFNVHYSRIDAFSFSRPISIGIRRFRLKAFDPIFDSHFGDADCASNVNELDLASLLESIDSRSTDAELLTKFLY